MAPHSPTVLPINSFNFASSTTIVFMRTSSKVHRRKRGDLDYLSNFLVLSKGEGIISGLFESYLVIA
jgi:hypothetical protein